MSHPVPTSVKRAGVSEMTPAVCCTTARKEKRSWCCGRKKSGGRYKCFSLRHRVCKVACEHFRHETSSKKFRQLPVQHRYVITGACKHDPEKLVMSALEAYEE